MNIVIVGAGIAGLTAAVALAKQGHNVHVFEKSVLKEKTGLGVGLQDFAVDALSDLGLTGLISEGILIKRTSFYTRKGKKIYEGSLNTLSNKGKLGVRRSALLSHLFDATIHHIGKDNIHSQHELISFQQYSSHVKVTFRAIRNDALVEIDADLLIGADGLHSTVRSILFPHDNSINFSGIITWRGFTHYPDFSNREMILMGDRFAKTVIYPVKVLPDGQIEYYWAAEVLQKNSILSSMPQDKEGKFDGFVNTESNFFALTQTRPRLGNCFCNIEEVLNSGRNNSTVLATS